jgi:hypothetical protein
MPTETPTETPTPTPRPTETPTPTPTPTPITAVVSYPYGLNVRAEPDIESELLLFLPQGTVVVVLDGQEEINGRVWHQIQSGNIAGWVLADYLENR